MLSTPNFWQFLYVLLDNKHTDTVDVARGPMLTWQLKSIKCYHGWPHSINIWDTVTKSGTLSSVYKAPAFEPNSTLLAWFLLKLAHMNMLFIVETVCTACTAGRLNNKYHIQISQLCGKWCQQSDNKLIWWRLVQSTQWSPFCDSIPDIDGMRSIFHLPG